MIEAEPFWERILRAVADSQFVVVIVSQKLLESSGALEEIRHAQLDNLRRVKLLPVAIEEVKAGQLPLALRVVMS